MVNPVERFADRGNRYRLRLREAVRDVSTPFALLTSLNMTEKAFTMQKVHKLSLRATDIAAVIEVICAMPHRPSHN